MDITRFLLLISKFFSIYFTISGVKKIFLCIQNFVLIEVCYIEVPLYFEALRNDTSLFACEDSVICQCECNADIIVWKDSGKGKGIVVTFFYYHYFILIFLHFLVKFLILGNGKQFKFDKISLSGDNKTAVCGKICGQNPQRGDKGSQCSNGTLMPVALPFCLNITSELTQQDGRGTEDGKPCVTSVTIILLETTFPQISFSFKQIFL